MNNLVQGFNPVFIGHGSPMNALANNAYTRFLNRLANRIGKPKAIVVISAHWQTRGTFITGGDVPEQIFDFYGFPEELYQVRYAPKGSQTVAEELHKSVAGIQIEPKRGIDHAAWAIVKHMYPDADVPLLEMSLDVNMSEQEHFEMGKLLRVCSPEILFMGSGNVVHNLRDISFDDNAIPFDWAKECDAWFGEKLKQGDVESLIHYKSHLPNHLKALPTNEHYLPLLYILGMQGEHDSLVPIFDEIQNGSISMRSIEVQRCV